MRFEIDRNGQYLVRFPQPRNVADIEALAAVFCAHESTLPTAERNPHLPRVTELLQQSKVFSDQKVNGNALAVTSSEEAKRLNERAKALVRQIQNLLSALYADQPERATQWGFEVRQSGSRAGKILVPATRDEVIKTLGKYIDTEDNRPLNEQFTVPRLSEVREVHKGLCTSLETRDRGTTTRKTGVAGSYEVAEALLDYLQAALAYLLVTQFERKVTPELGLWGYDVIARPAKPNGNGNGSLAPEESLVANGTAA